MKLFSLNELKEYNGKAGKPAYIAYKGKVYDVSDSRLWKDGDHQSRHSAGDDLTESIINAPHGIEALMKSPVVGEFSEEGQFVERLVSRIEKLHFHSMLVHFSIAYSMLVPILALLYILTGRTSFETTSYQILTFGLLSTPFAGLSGFFSWKVTYESVMTKIFIRKIVFAIVLTIITTLCFVLRTLIPNILIEGSFLGYLYILLLWSLIPIIMILGHDGGKLVYP